MFKSKFPSETTIVNKTRPPSASESGERYELTGNNGHIAYISTLRHDGLLNNNLLQVEILSKDQTASVRFHWTESKCSISRIGNESRFKTLEHLNEAVAEIVQVLNLVNPPLPFDPKVSKSDTVTSSHPVLRGSALPASFHPAITIVLGAPYNKARAATERWMVKTKEKEKHVSGIAGLSKAIVDGTILGEIDHSTNEAKKNKSRLALVRTISSGGTTRKRQLEGLYGFANSRPCTDKQIARFERLSSPDALTHVHDHCLRRHDRDKLEAAFRLSFKLEPGAYNPILETETKWVYSAEANEQRPRTALIRYVARAYDLLKEPEAPEHPDVSNGGQITMLPSQLNGWHVRLMDLRPAQDIALWSAALAPIDLAEGNPVHMNSGMGFMALKFGDKEEFHLRPALIKNEPSYPEAQIIELKRCIDAVLCGAPQRKNRFEKGLMSQWDKLQEIHQ